MTDDLQSIKSEVEKLRANCRQLSYRRRWAGDTVEIQLRTVEAKIKNILLTSPKDEEAWRLLSSVYEQLLLYPSAEAALETAMQIAARRDKNDLKRLAMLKETGHWWTRLGLTPRQLHQLGEFLLAFEHPDGSRQMVGTQVWANENGADATRLEKRLEDLGAFTDMQVLENIVK